MNTNYKYNYYADQDLIPDSPEVNNTEFAHEDQYVDHTQHREYYDVKSENVLLDSTDVYNQQQSPPYSVNSSWSSPKKSRMPYYIVPVLYVPKRVVPKAEISKNKTLQQSIDNLARKENQLYNLKKNYNESYPQNKLNVQYAQNHAGNVVERTTTTNPFTEHNYYDSLYDYSANNYEVEDRELYHNQQLKKILQKSSKVFSGHNDACPPKYYPTFNYCEEADLSTPITEQPYLDVEHSTDSSYIHQYTRDDWLTCQERRTTQNFAINSFDNPNVISINNAAKVLSLHSIGVNAVVRQVNNASQTFGMERNRNLCREVTTQTEQDILEMVQDRIKSHCSMLDKGDKVRCANQMKSAAFIDKTVPSTSVCTKTITTKSSLQAKNTFQDVKCSNPQKRPRPTEIPKKIWR